MDVIISLQKQVLKADESNKETIKMELAERTEDWRQEIASLRGNDIENFWQKHDSRKAFMVEPPILLWDQRKTEPLKVYAEEFFPKHELALLDIQPKPLPPILLENWPNNYEIYEFILFTLNQNPTQSVRAGMMALVPGAIDLIDQCPSITDPNKGGNMDLDLMNVRNLTLEMYIELVTAWAKWPFGPNRWEMLRRTGQEGIEGEEDSITPAEEE